MPHHRIGLLIFCACVLIVAAFCAGHSFDKPKPKAEEYRQLDGSGPINQALITLSQSIDHSQPAALVLLDQQTGEVMTVTITWGKR